MRRLFLTAVLFGGLAGCATTPRPMASVQLETLSPSEEAWRAAITPADAGVLDALPSIWSKVRAAADRRGAAAIDAEGPLLQPDSALDHPELPPGSYQCRVVRIGKGAGRHRIRSFPEHFCYVRAEDKDLSFAKQTGSDLPSGYLYADGDKRYVFLGARQRKPGDVSLGYGTDAPRDVVGVVERIGAFRWRLAIPQDSGNTIVVYELTPVPTDQQPS
jgi:hypothetical protein